MYQSTFFEKKTQIIWRIQNLSLPLPRLFCPDGGIGRRAGLKHQWINLHAGSIPALGTRKIAKYLINKYLALSFYRRCSQIVPNHPYVFRQRWGIYFMPSITFSIESGFSTIRNTESESNPIYSI